MRTTAMVLRNGIERGLIELRNSLGLLVGYMLFPLLLLVAMRFLQGVVGGDTGYSIGSYAIPGIVALNVMLSGLMGMASTLTQEREDGTLLRARCLPFGVTAFFIGKVVCQAILALITMLFVTTVAVIMLGGFHVDRLREYSSLLWVVPLSLASMLPLGAVAGAILRNPRQLNLLSFAVMAVTVVSGVLFPSSTLPAGVQWIGPLFPLYWLVISMRVALLDDSQTTALTGD